MRLSTSFAWRSTIQLVKMIQRQDIEGKQPEAVAQSLSEAYDEHCE